MYAIRSYYVLISDPDIDGPMAATASYVYFVLNKDLSSRYLARVPADGGEIEILGGPAAFDNLV